MLDLENWGSILAQKFALPRADPVLTNVSIPIRQIILTDVAGIRQQLGCSHRWAFSDLHVDVVLGTIAARQLLARSKNYMRKRDYYRSL